MLSGKYVSKKFTSLDSAIEFMNENYIPHELIISLTPSKYSNVGSYNEVREWTLVFNQTSSLPFFTKSK